MKKPIEKQENQSILIALIGMEDNPIQKSYFPLLRKKIDELDREREKYLSVFNNAVNGILRIRSNGDIFDFNPAMASMLKIFDDSPPLNLMRDFSVKEENMRKILRISERKKVQTDEMLTLKRRDGTPAVFSLNIHEINIDGERIWELFTNDITEKIKVEERLRQSQKMEAVGNLAGGIAHDFNNILTAITGAADMMMEHCEESEAGEYHRMIIHSTEVAADLISKLLTFSRRSDTERTEISLADVFEQASHILKRTINKKIAIVERINARDDLIHGNKSELINCILNLSINGCQAMPEGGTLTFKLENVKLYAGNYISLSIGDTGIGMEKEQISQIFEPFYTTKPLGKGTGLGLATVYAIIHDHNGFIDVESEKNQGSLFTIYLPLSDKS